MKHYRPSKVVINNSVGKPLFGNECYDTFFAFLCVILVLLRILYIVKRS